MSKYNDILANNGLDFAVKHNDFTHMSPGPSIAEQSRMRSPPPVHDPQLEKAISNST